MVARVQCAFGRGVGGTPHFVSRDDFNRDPYSALGVIVVFVLRSSCRAHHRCGIEDSELTHQRRTRKIALCSVWGGRFPVVFGRIFARNNCLINLGKPRQWLYSALPTPPRLPTHPPSSPPPLLIFLWRRLGRLWPALAASVAALYAVGRLAPASTTVHRFYFEMYGGGCGGRGLTPLLLSLGFVGDFVDPDRILFYRSKMVHFSRFCLLCEQASGRKANKKWNKGTKRIEIEKCHTTGRGVRRTGGAATPPPVRPPDIGCCAVTAPSCRPPRGGRHSLPPPTALSSRRSARAPARPRARTAAHSCVVSSAWAVCF